MIRFVGRKVILALGLPVVLIAAWWFGTANSDSFYWPSLGSILGVFDETWFTGRFAADVVPSLLRLLVGYFLALVIGVRLGAAIGSFPTFRALTEPMLEFFRAIPPPVLVPIFIIFAGIGDGMKVLVIVVGSVWPVLLNTVEGVRGLDDVLQDTARSYGLKGPSKFFRFVLRGASPQIAAGARQALSLGIILMVISEMFAASNGLGFTIVQFQRSFALPEMWSGIIMLGLLGVAMSVLFRVVELWALSWYFGLRKSQGES